MDDIPDGLMDLLLEGLPRNIFFWTTGILISVFLAVSSAFYNELTMKLTTDAFNRYEERQHQYNEDMLKTVHNLSLAVAAKTARASNKPTKAKNGAR